MNKKGRRKIEIECEIVAWNLIKKHKKALVMSVIMNNEHIVWMNHSEYVQMKCLTNW